MAVPLSGDSFALSCGEYSASIASVGASLRTLTFGDRPLVAGYPLAALRPAMSGGLMAPWPNRIADARYVFAGECHELVMNEPETQTASHGLIAWQEFVPVRQTPSTIVLCAVVAAQPGYPWRVRVTASYALTPDGLQQSLTVRNESDSPAPVGLGAHPYLVAGAPADDAAAGWTLTLPADEILLTDDRFLPTVLMPVDEAERGAYDFRQGRRLGGLAVNHAFTGLRRARDGLATARLLADDGTGVALAWDGAWVQVYTADQRSGAGRRHAVAVEPMTCPPDAFTSGDDLRVVAPGESTALAWSICAVG